MTDSRQTHEIQWQYNANNALLHSGFATYEYNEAGSTLAKRNSTTNQPIQTYTYNSEERMSEVRDADDNLVAEYYYDPFGRRLWKMLHPGGEAQEIHYMGYSDEGYAAEYVHRGGGQSEPQPSDILLYVFAPDGLWSTDSVAKKQPTEADPEWAYYQTDHLGTPMQLVAQHGASAHDRRMAAFGEVRTLGMGDGLRFAGQVENVETGTYYNYFRDYVPQLGRYGQWDPIGLEGGVNVFAYGMNSPIRYFDSLGLSPDCWEDCEDHLETLEPQRNQACREVGTTITDPDLARCVEEKCRTALVVCRKQCLVECPGQQPRTRGNPGLADRRNDRIFLCFDASHDSDVRRSGWGSVMMHEFAHLCDWEHCDGKGVPRDYSTRECRRIAKIRSGNAPDTTTERCDLILR